MRFTRRAIVATLDILTVLLAVLSAAIANGARFVTRIDGIRISATTPVRALILLGAVVLVRVLLDRRLGPFGVSRAGWRRVFPPSGSDLFLAPVPAGAWRRTAWAAAGLALALAVLLHDQLWHPYSVPDIGDPIFSMWRVGWVTHQLVTDPLHLFDANIFYPERLTLALSDSMILPALTAAPLRLLGISPALTYNLLLLSAFWLSGIATYLLVERLTGSPRAAFIAGLTYACYSYRFDHYSHLELQMTHWMPLGLLALHLFITTARWPYAIALALAGVAQLYSSMYYAVFFLVYAITLAIGLVLVHRPRIRPLLLPIGAAVAVAGILAVPLVRAFVAAKPIKGERLISEVEYYSATPIDYLRSQKYSVLWRHRLLPAEPERGLFPGAAPLTLGTIGLAPPLGAMRLAYTAGLLVSFDGSLGLNGWLYPYLHRWLAPVRELRAPARFSAVVGLTLAILTGFGARRVLRWHRSRAYAHAAFAALIALVMIDAWPALELRPVWEQPPAFYERIAGRPDAVLAEFPMAAEKDTPANLPFMYFSLWHWRPMVNGYSGFSPRSYGTLVADTSAFPDPGAIAALRQRGVTHVTVNCGLGYAGCEDLRSRARNAPRLRLVENARWNDVDVQLYEILN